MSLLRLDFVVSIFKDPAATSQTMTVSSVAPGEQRTLTPNSLAISRLAAECSARFEKKVTNNENGDVLARLDSVNSSGDVPGHR